MDIKDIIIELKVNESKEKGFNIELHEKLLYKLFMLGYNLEEIGKMKGLL